MRSRVRLAGPGIDDRGIYDPAALRGWKLVVGEGGRPMWENRGWSGGGNVLYEDVLGEVERRLLGTDPETFDFVLKGGVRAKR